MIWGVKNYAKSHNVAIYIKIGNSTHLSMTKVLDQIKSNLNSQQHLDKWGKTIMQQV